ncbi:hypothetical protein KI387_038010, partial [Taxus chinensis]
NDEERIDMNDESIPMEVEQEVHIVTDANITMEEQNTEFEKKIEEELGEQPNNEFPTKPVEVQTE